MSVEYYRRLWHKTGQILILQTVRARRYRLAWLSARRRANRLQKIVDELSAPRIYEETESLERIESAQVTEQLSLED